MQIYVRSRQINQFVFRMRIIELSKRNSLFLSTVGTVITEYDDGFKKCSEFLESRESYTCFANKLVAIAQYYMFDGWLLNFENEIKVW